MANWSALGSNGAGNGSLNDDVFAIAVSGSNVYVGGAFQDAGGIAAADRIAMWNGTTWSALSSLSDDVNAIAVSGSNVYVGGAFQNAGGIAAADRIAMWNGTTWSALGASAALTNNQVNAIAISGTDVYVGGSFTDAAGIAAADRIARWNGTVWSALGASAAFGGGSQVNAIAVSGTDVYVGGNFTNAATIGAADYIARWNGATWSALGSNGSGGGSISGMGATVSAIAISGSNVYVGGNFSNVNNNGTTLDAADDIAMWNGTNWSALGSNGASNGSLGFGVAVNALAASGSNVYVGGDFTDVNNNGTVLVTADYITQWNGSAWSNLGSVSDGSLSDQVNAIAISGTDVYVGGQFFDLNNNGTILGAADYIAKWDGTNWSALGSDGAGDGSLNNDVNAIAVSGSNVYVGGQFDNVNNNGTTLNAADFIAVWNGTNWSALGASAALNNDVNAIAVSGSNVYVGGQFTNAAGIGAADFIALWNGSTWSALGASAALNNDVNAIAVSGSNVYVGGQFDNAAGIGAADFIALWNGSAWSALGASAALNNDVNAIAVSGSNVYVGGQFTNAAGIGTADYIARWNGSAWSNLGSNGSGDGSISGGGGVSVNTIVITGIHVFVGGSFTNVSNNGTTLGAADRIARWNGNNWFALGSNGGGNGSLNNDVNAIALNSTDAYVGGQFTNVNNNGTVLGTADYVAAYGLPDVVSPSTTSFARQNPASSLTNADTLVFRATFSEDVTGVDVADFAVNGTTTATVMGVSPVSASVYDVTVSSGDLASFNGVVGLNFSASPSITDLNFNPLPNTEPGTDETYTLDNIAPSTTSFIRQTPATSPTNADTLVFRATFSEDVTGVGAADFAVNGTTTATVTGVSPVSASVYDVTVSGGDLASFNGVVGLDYNGSMNITDPAGNSLPNTEPGTDETYTLDNAAPSTTSFARQNPAANPTNADTLVFRVTFNEAVTGVDVADFAVNGTTTATVTGVSPVSASIYDVTVSGGDLASFNGVVGLDFNSPTIADLVGNSLPSTEPGTDETYTLDNIAPSTTSFIRQTPATSPTNADTLVFRATFSEDVTGVGTADFAVNGTTTATVTGVSPVSASVYDVTVSGGDLASFNGVVGLDYNGSMNITDPAGNSLPNTEPGTDETYTVDNSAPSTTSFALQNPATSPTNADTLVFRATFSEGMTGVDVTDFAVNGTTTATVSNVSLVSASEYDVTVSGGDLASFNGVVGLDFSGSMNITDLAGNSLPNTEPGTDESYTLDNNAPSTTSFTRQTPAASLTNADTLVFRATFSEDVTGVGTADFAVNGTTTATVTGVSPVSASVYDVTVSGGDLASFNGVVGLDFSGSMDIADPAGNSLPNTEPGIDETYTLDNAAPSTTSFARQNPATSPTNADTLVFRATFSEDVTGVDVADFAVNGTTTATVTGVSPVSASVYDVTVSGGDLASFNGVVGLNFTSPSISDLVSNPLPNTEPGTDQTYTLDNTAPSTTSFTLQTPASSPTNADTLVFRATFSEDVTGVGVADFAVNGTTTATVTGVSPVSASVYDVTVSGGDLASFNGVAGLNFSASPVITDLVSNPLANTEPGTDQTYTLDNTAPGVTLNQASGQSDPTSASPINFTVVFNEAINPATFTGTDVTLGGTANPTTATVSQIAPLDGTTFNVAVSGMNATGTVTAVIQSGLINDLAGNANNASISSDNTVNYIFASSPVITEGASVNVVMSQNGSPIPFALTLNATDPNGDPLTWSILSQGSQGVAGVIAGPAASTSVSYTPALNFFGSDSFVVQVSDGALTDTITVNVTITAVQMPAPVVLSSKRADPNPTADVHVNYIVTFSSPVTGVDMSDFTVTMTGGVAGSAVIAVNGSGSVYTVTVNTGSNVGTIRLDVLDNNSIVDAFSTPLDGGFTSGEVYTIIHKSPIFADVPFSHWANSHVERLYHAGITGGCGTNPLIYCPESYVTRAEMAVFIMKTIHGPFYVSPSATGNVFNDVPATHWAAAWIEQFRAEGLTAGCGNNNYCPEQVLTTRAQMAVFLLRARYGSNYQPPAASGSVFNDVAADYWAAAWIERLAAEGITSGCGGGSYCPEAPLTRAEMAVFLVKTLYIPKDPNAIMPVAQ